MAFLFKNNIVNVIEILYIILWNDEHDVKLLLLMLYNISLEFPK